MTPLQGKKILLAGYGNMGRALASGWCESGIDPASVIVVDPVAAAQAEARARGMTVFEAPDQVTAAADIAVLAVKPALIESVLAVLPAMPVYLSIAAGRSIADLARSVSSKAAIIRAMPNTPAAIGLGMTGLCANESATTEQRNLAAMLMTAVGQVEWLADEHDMDALTAVSGSGPAYVFLLIECLTDAAVAAGLAPDLAERLAVATVHGAGAYAAASGVGAAELRRQVTSPNGTTEAALARLLEGDALRDLLRNAVDAAARRSRELRSA